MPKAHTSTKTIKRKRTYKRQFGYVPEPPPADLTSEEREARRRTLISWNAMLNRCLNPNDPSYPRYGGRGIMVCNRWLKFENFVEDMGYRPAPDDDRYGSWSIDRINNDRGYHPDNCQWATDIVQRADSRGRKLTKEQCQRRKENARKLWANPEYRAKRLAAFARPEVKARMSEAARNRKLRATKASERLPRNNTTGYKGVYFHKRTGKYQAGASKKNYVGLFDTAHEAAAALKKSQRATD